MDDSCHLLTYQEVETLIDMVQPRIVIPMHYQIPGLMSESTTLKTIDEWLATRTQVRRLGGHRIPLSQTALPAATETWVFEPAPECWQMPLIEA